MFGSNSVRSQCIEHTRREHIKMKLIAAVAVFQMIFLFVSEGAVTTETTDGDGDTRSVFIEESRESANIRRRKETVKT